MGHNSVMGRGPRATRVEVAVLILVALFLVGLAYLAATVGSPPQGTAFELRRYLIQFLLLVALGAEVAFLGDRMKRRAEEREAERRRKREAADRKQQFAIDTARSLLDRLDATYRRVKRTRQRLGFRPGHRSDNESDMWDLRDEQEDLEQLAKDIEVHAVTIPDLSSVRGHVAAMDNYLGRCWSEYKKGPPVEQGATDFGERLLMFVASPKSGGSDFQIFSADYHSARRDLIVLLNPARHNYD